MASYLRWIILLKFLLLNGARYSAAAQEPDETETWRGSNRLVATEDLNPFAKKQELRWVPGLMCGWTPYGLCFSPEARGDIHYNFIIPFKSLTLDVYCDQPADPAMFGINSVVLTEFKQKQGYLWEGRVRGYSNAWNSKRQTVLPYRIQVRTFYHDLKEQITEWFSPSQVRLKGAHNACRYLKTDCKASERCVPRWVSGHVWPGQYKCVCKSKGFKEIRGQGCFDVDECQNSPCGALAACVNTFGSYKCNCKNGFEGKDCKTDVDECKENPCPKNRACVNEPGSFQCICLKGYEGEDCSEEEAAESPRGRPPVIRDYNNKRIAIPQKRPIKAIRKPIHSHDARSMERAGLATVILLFHSLGVYLYWREKKKKADIKEAETEVKSQSDVGNVENKGRISSIQDVEVEFKGLSGQGTSVSEGISNNQEEKTNAKDFQACQQLLDNETVSKASDNQNLLNLVKDNTDRRDGVDNETSPRHEEQEIYGEMILDSQSLEEMDEINQNLQKREHNLISQEMENAEINSLNTREVTNTEATSTNEEVETGTKLVQDNKKDDNDEEVISNVSEDNKVTSGNEENAE